MPRLKFLLAALAVPLLAHGPAAAQPQVGKPSEGLQSNRYMEYKSPKARLVETQYFIYPAGGQVVSAIERAGEVRRGLEMIVPYVLQSGNAWATSDQAGYPKTRITINHRDGEAAFDAQTGRVPGTQAPYMVFTAPQPLFIERLQVVQTNALVVAETVFNEKAAWDVAWPDRWPADASVWLDRDPVVDVVEENGADEVQALLDSWTGGNDPRGIPPVQLAKFLTAKVIEHIRHTEPPVHNPRATPASIISGGTVVAGETRVRGRITNHHGMIGGFNIQNAGTIARSGRGSPHDDTVLLTAVLRRAGIPARTVIGVDDNESHNHKRFKSWVEFALVAPDVDRVVWVPIDTVELRGSGRNTRSWQQPWKHFGTSDLLRETPPVAFNFHPPVNYDSYAAPALYGVRSDTDLGDFGIQGVIANVSSQPNRGGN
jgi:hypothetical protein